MSVGFVVTLGGIFYILNIEKKGCLWLISSDAKNCGEAAFGSFFLILNFKFILSNLSSSSLWLLWWHSDHKGVRVNITEFLKFPMIFMHVIPSSILSDLFSTFSSYFLALKRFLIPPAASAVKYWKEEITWNSKLMVLFDVRYWSS